MIIWVTGVYLTGMIIRSVILFWQTCLNVDEPTVVEIPSCTAEKVSCAWYLKVMMNEEFSIVDKIQLLSRWLDVIYVRCTWWFWTCYNWNLWKGVAWMLNYLVLQKMNQKEFRFSIKIHHDWAITSPFTIIEVVYFAQTAYAVLWSEIEPREKSCILPQK